jgi:hypothetical protein
MGVSVKRLVCGWVFCFGCCAAWGQAKVASPPSAPATKVVEPPAPLLPTNDHLVANDSQAGMPVDSPEVAKVLSESGLKRIETRAVIVPAGGVAAPTGWVRAYQFVDATGAFAAYTYFRQGGRLRQSPPDASSVTLPSGEIVLLEGVSVVRAQIKQSPESISSLLTLIETGLPKVGGSKGVPPRLPRLLPKQGLEVETVRYALGPVQYHAMGGVLPAEILGWEKSAEVATAKYAGRKGTGTLTVLLYPTPEIAGDRGRAVQDAVNKQGAARFGTVRLRREGSLVAMTSGAFTPEQAEALVQSVHQNEEVTFDKATPDEFHVEIRKTVSLLQSIAIFTGVGIVGAIVLGLFLGGGRAGIRVLQGKPAWVDPEFLTIDLRGRPEPLKPVVTVPEERERR